MGYEPILRLDIRHGYYGEGRKDLEVRPLDPQAFARDDILLRRDGPSVVILAPPAYRPKEVALVVLGEGPGLITATKGVDWEGLPEQKLSLEKDDWLFGESKAKTTRRPFGDQRSLAATRIAVSPVEEREITLRFQSEEVIWAYHVLGRAAEKELSVVDPDEVISFEDLGPHALPNGAEAHVLRAQQGIAARARPPQKFALKTPGNFGPQTLVEVLPGPSIDRLKPFRHAENSAQFQADIFVTLN